LQIARRALEQRAAASGALTSREMLEGCGRRSAWHACSARGERSDAAEARRREIGSYPALALTRGPAKAAA